MWSPWTLNFGGRKTSTISGRDTGFEAECLLSSQPHGSRNTSDLAVLAELGRCTTTVALCLGPGACHMENPGAASYPPLDLFEAEAILLGRREVWKQHGTWNPGTGFGPRP